MNIKEAKDQIKNSISIYFAKDKDGEYKIPSVKQRPVFLMGPPGIGKTAIMEQIAQDMNIGLLSYSMTHHTRQSAIGLPIIEKKNYGGKEYNVSEYTMSEIIASIYDMIEETGQEEGILFLDEINCVSETLSPIMLQFLQYKVFGRHKVPDSWIVVTAGNPPEYNDSVREFDIVTWDRLKRIDVEPDYKVWKEYAYKACIHPAILTYLDIKKENFYRVETTVDGKTFVTARGWEDLSSAIILYEEFGFMVDKQLIIQYLQNDKICTDFAQYYDLFNTYEKNYEIDKILDKQVTEKIKETARESKFDERLALLGLLIDAINSQIRDVLADEELMIEYKNTLMKFSTMKLDNVEAWESIIDSNISEMAKQKKSNSLSIQKKKVYSRLIELLQSKLPLIKQEDKKEKVLKKLLADYKDMHQNYSERGEEVSEKLNNVFYFIDEVFEDGNEALILVTELTMNYYSARFISRFNCEEYFAHNKELLFYERQKELIDKLENLELDSSDFE